MVGRAIFGIGSEAQMVWLATVINIWFHYENLCLASAMVSLSGKIGSLVANYISMYLYEEYKKVEVTQPPSLIINSLVMLAVIWINVIQERYDGIRDSNM